jgi:GNAT superfamily N-acetyltransferase
MELSIRAEADLQKAFKLQGHLKFQGIPIAIENREGSVRRWTGADGTSGSTKMHGVSYGYIKGTNGTDEDEIDCFIGPDPRAQMVYVVEQQDQSTGMYDEQKCMIGFSNQDLAERAYRQHYDNPENFFLTIEPIHIEQFKLWVEGTKPKPGEMMKAKYESKKWVNGKWVYKYAKPKKTREKQAQNLKDEVTLLQDLNTLDNRLGGILRIFMDKNEIQAANRLVDEGYVKKGPSDTKQGNITYTITMEGQDWLRDYLDEQLARKLQKSGGPFIGPKGGKWADAAHTIPWDDKDVEPGSRGHMDALKQQLQKQFGVSLHVFDRGKEISVGKIVVPKSERSVGTGTAAMQAITRYADAHGKTISLTPSADFGGTKSRLVKFYKKLGFVENKGRNKDYEISETMYRLPKGEVKKSGLALVVPLEKSLSPEIGAATSPAGKRAPGPGLGINYVITVPRGGKPNTIHEEGYSPTNRELLDDKEEFEVGAFYVDKDVYEILEPFTKVFPYIIPQEWDQYQEEARNEAETNMEWITNEAFWISRDPKNTAEVKPTKEGKPKKPVRTPMRATDE